MPHETLVEGNLSVTVRGIELDEEEEEVIVIGTTNPITYIVYPSGYTGSGTNVPPVTPTLYDQILAISTSAETKADSILASEALRVAAELARKGAEEGRVTNEGLRDDAIEALTDPPDNTEAGNIGTPTVTLIDNVKTIDGTPKTFKKFKFTNLKGEKR